MSGKGLGRGFDSLIPSSFDASILQEEQDRIQKLSISILEPNPDQPRKHFDEKSLQELSKSIKRFGILQPIVATKKDANTFYIVAGERRYRAAKLAGLKTVPAIVRSSQELERLEIALVENVQRQDLSALEQATSIVQLHTQFSVDYETIAERLGKAPATVSNIVRLLQLPLEAQKALSQGKISEGHARAILAIKATADQLKLLSLIMSKNWTVRQAEQYVAAQKSGLVSPKDTASRVSGVTPETKKLSQLLGTRVSLKRTAKGGKLEIAFSDDQDLGRILKSIKV